MFWNYGREVAVRHPRIIKGRKEIDLAGGSGEDRDGAVAWPCVRDSPLE